tara:strand:- start:402 stop:722 length:321 start_codon:yes stop_codon:yes gene_type:complete
MNITKKAIARVEEMASKLDLTNYNLRIMVVGGGCSGFSYEMDFDDAVQPTDLVLEEGGLNILVDPMSFQYLDGTKIDHVESFQFTGFQFDNPNAKSTCGCGSSFTM